MKNNSDYERDLFGDSIIYRTTDEYGDILVIDRCPYLNLTFDSMYDQSSMDLRNPHLLVHEYTYVMMLVLAFIKPHHATILGLGGGCLLRSLHRLMPQCQILAVELRQAVYEVASEFFALPASKYITTCIADAKSRLHEMRDGSTQVIFADMFDAYSMNPFQMQEQFIDQCHRILSKKGWLVVNYHEVSKEFTPFFKLLRSIFPDVFIYNTVVGNNNVIFASKEKIGSLQNFNANLVCLEKKMGRKSINLFNRLTRVTSEWMAQLPML